MIVLTYHMTNTTQLPQIQNANRDHAKDGTLEELSTLSPLVAALSGRATGDKRFYFPKEMLATQDSNLFSPIYEKFQHYLLNGGLIDPHFND